MSWRSACSGDTLHKCWQHEVSYRQGSLTQPFHTYWADGRLRLAGDTSFISFFKWVKVITDTAPPHLHSDSSLYSSLFFLHTCCTGVLFPQYPRGFLTLGSLHRHVFASKGLSLLRPQSHLFSCKCKCRLPGTPCVTTPSTPLNPLHTPLALLCFWCCLHNVSSSDVSFFYLFPLYTLTERGFCLF